MSENRDGLKFHIESDDYFGTLATVLSLIKQTPKNIRQHTKTLDNLIEDLLFLQKEYKIEMKKN